MDILYPITPVHYLVLSMFLFVMGLMGVLLRRNLLIIFMSIELMLSGANLAFITFAEAKNNMEGHVFVFMIITIAAAEAAVGLAIIIALFRNKDTVNADELNLMKW